MQRCLLRVITRTPLWWSHVSFRRVQKWSATAVRWSSSHMLLRLGLEHALPRRKAGFLDQTRGIEPLFLQEFAELLGPVEYRLDSNVDQPLFPKRRLVPDATDVLVEFLNDRLGSACRRNEGEIDRGEIRKSELMQRGD